MTGSMDKILNFEKFFQDSEFQESGDAFPMIWENARNFKTSIKGWFRANSSKIWIDTKLF